MTTLEDGGVGLELVDAGMYTRHRSVCNVTPSSSGGAFLRGVRDVELRNEIVEESRVVMTQKHEMKRETIETEQMQLSLLKVIERIHQGPHH
jgi:hypothetical protein